MNNLIEDPNSPLT
jgi:hypothetical protein